MKKAKLMRRGGALVAAAAMAALLAVGACGCASQGASDQGASGDGNVAAPAEGAEGNGASDAQPAETEKITFILDWTPNTNHTGLYVAQAEGYFAEQGLDVQIVQPADGTAEALVASGKGQFGVSFQDTMAPALVGEDALPITAVAAIQIVQPADGTAEALVASGKGQFGVSFQDTMAPALVGEDALPITAVAAIQQHNTSGIVSRAGEGMDHPAGLEGHKYATWELPVEQATIAEVMKADGGDFAKVELYPESVTDEVSALSSKMVDAIWVFEGWGKAACDVAGLATDYFNFADIDPVFDYYTPVVIANNQFLEEHPETAKKFLAALAKGYQYAIDNPDAAADILMEQVPELAANEQLVRASQQFLSKQYKADAAQWGVMDADRWEAFYQWLLDNQLIDAALDPTAGFTNQYL